MEQNGFNHDELLRELTHAQRALLDAFELSRRGASGRGARKLIEQELGVMRQLKSRLKGAFQAATARVDDLATELELLDDDDTPSLEVSNGAEGSGRSGA